MENRVCNKANRLMCEIITWVWQSKKAGERGASSQVDLLVAVESGSGLPYPTVLDDDVSWRHLVAGPVEFFPLVNSVRLIGKRLPVKTCGL